MAGKRREGRPKGQDRRAKFLESHTLDENKRPLVQQNRVARYRGLSPAAADVLYALALTELRGNTFGLTKRSIAKVLEYRDDPLAGEWNWLFDPNVGTRPSDKHTLTTKRSTNSIRNGLQELLQTHPIVVLKPGKYVEVPGYRDRSMGGIEPDVYALNRSLERWPCGAHLLKTLAVAIPNADAVRFGMLAHYMPAEHASHPFPPGLVPAGKQGPDTHTLAEDVEFLLWSRYIKLFREESRGTSKRTEIPHSRPLPELRPDTIIELDQRATWEMSYIVQLAAHFAGK